ncbi:MAG: hypothetical protein AB8G18_16090 [Gammaproteobacteria bacterium]
MNTTYKLAGALVGLSMAHFSMAEPYLGKLSEYLSVPSSVDAQIQTIEYTPEIRSLTDKLTENLEKNSEWFEQYSSQLAPGKRIPYHPNMGLTEAQYQQLLGGEEQTRLTPTGGARLSFTWRDDDVLKIQGLPDEAPFDTLLYEGVSDSLITSFGTLSNSVSAKGKLGGESSLAWEGRLWATERKDDKGQLSIVYVLGDLDEGDRGVLIHEIKGVVNNVVVEHHYMLMWNR